MAKLATYVHVHDEHGKTHVYGPHDVVPDWAQEKITNPKAWEVPPAGGTAPAAPSGGTPAGGRSEPEVCDLPPRSGKGSGKESWAAYAAAHDVQVPDGASREDIIELLQQAGVPVDPVAE